MKVLQEKDILGRQLKTFEVRKHICIFPSCVTFSEFCMMGSSYCLLLSTCFFTYAFTSSRWLELSCLVGPLLSFAFLYSNIPSELNTTFGFDPFLYVPRFSIQHASLFCHRSFLRSIYSINGFPVIAFPQ